MEEIFTKLKKSGKNNVDNLMKWLKESKVIDKTKEQDEKVRAFFRDVADKNDITVEKFKEVVKQVADTAKKNVDGVKKQLADHGPAIVEDLKERATDAAGTVKATVDAAVKDYKPKVLPKEQEEKIKKVVKKVAEETKKNVDDVKKMVKEHGPPLLEDIRKSTTNAACTLKDAVNEVVKDLKRKK